MVLRDRIIFRTKSDPLADPNDCLEDQNERTVHQLDDFTSNFEPNCAASRMPSQARPNPTRRDPTAPDSTSDNIFYACLTLSMIDCLISVVIGTFSVPIL